MVLYAGRKIFRLPCFILYSFLTRSTSTVILHHIISRLPSIKYLVLPLKSRISLVRYRVFTSVYTKYSNVFSQLTSCILVSPYISSEWQLIQSIVLVSSLTSLTLPHILKSYFYVHFLEYVIYILGHKVIS